MKIHDTEKLRKRADSHAAEDHIKQGTYGNAETNGHTTYIGCAVSCLATPSMDEGLVDLIKEEGELSVGDDGKDMWVLADFSTGTPFRPARLHYEVKEQFGINETLMIIAEGLFEAQPTHGAAIEFVKAFAHSFEEGEDITKKMAHDWAYITLDRDPTHWELIYNIVALRAGSEKGTPTYKATCKQISDEFLEFCKDPSKIPTA